MTAYRRRFRPTMAHRRHDATHKRPAPLGPLIAAAIGAPIPGAAIWRSSHGRKTEMLFCEALRTLKSSAHLPRYLDGPPMHTYPCEEGAAPGLTGPRHWHVGRRAC